MSVPGVINFPTTLDDAISLVEANNHASCALTNSINNSQLTITITQPSEFSNSGYATILDSLTNPTTIEIVRYTSKSGSDLVIPVGGRGQQGTSAASFSAGAFIEQRPTARHHTVLADAIIAVQQKIGYGVPISPLDILGTNQAGSPLEIAGGRGTGNAAPGLIANRYPLTKASGTTQHTHSTASFPHWVNMHTRGDNTTTITVANTTTETSILGASQYGSTKTIEAGLGRIGRRFKLRLIGSLGSTGTPTLRIRLYLGTTLIADTTALNVANNTNSGSGGLEIVADVLIMTVGATGTVHVPGMRCQYASGFTGQFMSQLMAQSLSTVVDLTAAQTFDVTAQWGTANASNSIAVTDSYIEMCR
jgi:hypothetical protein